MLESRVRLVRLGRRVFLGIGARRGLWVRRGIPDRVVLWVARVRWVRPGVVVHRVRGACKAKRGRRDRADKGAAMEWMEKKVPLGARDLRDRRDRREIQGVRGRQGRRDTQGRRECKGSGGGG